MSSRSSNSTQLLTESRIENCPAWRDGDRISNLLVDNGNQKPPKNENTVDYKHIDQ